MNSKQIERAIQKSAKKAIAESGLGSSRAGNKELSHLAARLSSQAIASLEIAQMLGEQLGRKIVELSQASNKQHLDRGIIRTLVLTKAVPSVPDLPSAIQTDATANKSSQVNKAPSAKASPPAETEPVVQLVDEPAIEDKVPAIQAEAEEGPAEPLQIAAAETEPEEQEASELLEVPVAVMHEKNDTATIQAEVVAETATDDELDEADDAATIEPEAVEEPLSVEELEAEEEPAAKAV